MNPTRNGKIAHLPLHLREALNHRLDNGIPGHELLAWLNADPEVQRILAQYYPGRRITQQNLSEWRCGGYQDWVKLRETRHLTLQLAKEPENPETEINPRRIIDAMATISTAEFAFAAQSRLRECTTTKERWKHVCEVNTQLSRLRRDNHREVRHALDHPCSVGQVTNPVTSRAPRFAPDSTSIPQPPDATGNNSRHSYPDPTLRYGKKEVKNAHFPSGTDRNQIQKNFNLNQPASVVSSSPVRNSRSTQYAASPINSLPPILSLTPDHPATMFLTRPASPLRPRVKTI